MTKKPNNSIDGFFIPRRQSQAPQDRIGLDTVLEKPKTANQQRSSHEAPVRIDARQQQSRTGALDMTDLGQEIEEQLGNGKKNRRERKQDKKLERTHSKKRRITKWVLIALLIIILAVGGYFGYKFFAAGGKIVKGNLFSAIFDDAKPLKADANGWSNIVVFGTSEDDPSHTDPNNPAGPDLADSIMMLSVNQTKKQAFMISVPRDLQVKYGKACVSGYEGKVNVTYLCSKDESEDAGQAAMRSVVGTIFGVDVQYSAHLNYSVLKDVVDAVGGITVDITSDDPRGILDRNFDWNCPGGKSQSCYNVRYPIGPAQLDGIHALYLARARGDDPLGRTYGLSRSNPDREDNQRKILVAIQQKAVSGGVLANPVAVNNILTTFGDNLRTNFDASEIKTLLSLAKDVPSSAIKSLSLSDPDNLLVTSCGSNICPSAGMYDYSAIQSLISAYATGDLAGLENAKVDVLNASGTPGMANTKATELEKQSITIEVTGNAPASYASSGAVQLYDASAGKKPETLKKLENILGIKAISGLPQGVSSTSDFVIILGNGS
jgi:LCP family protein required for cell wall assembly